MKNPELQVFIFSENNLSLSSNFTTGSCIYFRYHGQPVRPLFREVYYNGFKYGDWSPTRIRLASGRITNDGSDLEQQGSE